MAMIIWLLYGGDDMMIDDMMIDDMMIDDMMIDDIIMMI